MTATGHRPVDAVDRPVTLESSYRRCRELNRRYGTTYYWATFALPRVKRHHVWALYGFWRMALDTLARAIRSQTDPKVKLH